MPIWEDEHTCWIGDPIETTCHGCSGKGWVETSDHQAHQCPVCLGSGKYNNTPGFVPYEPYVPQIQPYPYQPVIPNNPVYPGIGYPWVISSDSTKTPPNLVTSGGSSVGVVSGGALQTNITTSKEPASFTSIWSKE